MPIHKVPPTEHTNEGEEIRIFTEIYERAKLDPSYILVMIRMFSKKDPETIMNELKELVE